MRLNNCFLPLATVDELLASQSQSLHVISLYVFSLKLVKGNIYKIISLDCLSLITSFCVEHIKCGKSHNGTDYSKTTFSMNYNVKRLTVEVTEILFQNKYK